MNIGRVDYVDRFIDCSFKCLQNDYKKVSSRCWDGNITHFMPALTEVDFNLINT